MDVNAATRCSNSFGNIAAERRDDTFDREKTLVAVSAFEARRDLGLFLHAR